MEPLHVLYQQDSGQKAQDRACQTRTKTPRQKEKGEGLRNHGHSQKKQEITIQRRTPLLQNKLKQALAHQSDVGAESPRWLPGVHVPH